MGLELPTRSANLTARDYIVIRELMHRISRNWINPGAQSISHECLRRDFCKQLTDVIRPSPNLCGTPNKRLLKTTALFKGFLAAPWGVMLVWWRARCWRDDSFVRVEHVKPLHADARHRLSSLYVRISQLFSWDSP